MWTCGCPVCRLIAYPLLRRLLRGLRVREEPVEEVMEEVSEEQPEPVSREEAEELRRLVEALRDSVMELRSAISDLTSPFNMMRREEAREELESIEEAAEEPVPVSASAKQVSAAMPVQVQVQPQPKAEAGARRPSVVYRPPEAREKPEAAETQVAEAFEAAGRTAEAAERIPPPSREIERTEVGVARPRAPRLGMSRALRLLRLLYELRRKLSSHSIESLVRMLVVMGVIDEGTEEAAKYLLELVDEGIRSGLTPEDQALIIYSLAKTLGVEDRELDEEVVGLLLKRLRGGADWGSQRQ